MNITYNDLIKKEDKNTMNDKYERLQKISYINKKENYEDNNNIINDLQNEILSLKRKMKYVFEKDEEIEKLNIEINKLKNTLINNDNKYLNENNNLKKLIKSLKDKNLEYLNQIESILFDEQKDKDIIEKKINEINDLNRKYSILKKKYNIIKDEKNYDTIDFDLEPKLYEKVRIDIKKFKDILKCKFKDKNYEKILVKYEIDKDKTINKNTMNDIIKEIMLI